MAKLGEIIFDKMLVTKITNGGTPIEYYDLESGKRTLTSYGASIKNKNKILALSDEELTQILQALNIKRYCLLKRNFIKFLKDIQKGINERLNSDKAFVYAIHEELDKDILLVIVNGKQIEIAITKEIPQ